AMGQRLRLKSSFTIPSYWTTEEKAVLLALKKYGAIVADNGGFFSVSVCPDDRFPANAFNNLSTIDVNNFEVIQTTGPNEEPRSLGAPSANAGVDQQVSGLTTTLAGTVNDPSKRIDSLEAVCGTRAGYIREHERREHDGHLRPGGIVYIPAWC
ncbi:MAG: hypothetical protein ABJB69_10080, partial [Spartobacteria bacterium]